VEFEDGRKILISAERRFPEIRGREYEFGYKKNGKRIVTWRYTVVATGPLTTDDRPGKIVLYVDIAGAAFYNFMTQNAKYFQLSTDAQARFEAIGPFSVVRNISLREMTREKGTGWTALTNKNVRISSASR